MDLLCYTIRYINLERAKLSYDHLFCFYLGSQFFIKLLLSVSRLLYLGSQFFIELLLSVEQNINRQLALSLQYSDFTFTVNRL